MDFFTSILLILLGISMIGTIIQKKNELWINSQNMFFGCAVGVILKFIGAQNILVLIITIISIIISFIIFKFFINKEILKIESDSFSNMLLTIATIIVLIGVLGMVCRDEVFIKTMFKDPIMLIFSIMMIISVALGIPKFIRFIKEFQIDDLEDGDRIYVEKSFWESGNRLDIRKFNNKTVKVIDLNIIINKRAEVFLENNNFYIVIDNVNYYIKEIDNKPLEIGDIVKISKANLNNGIIKRNDIVLVEKENLCV